MKEDRFERVVFKNYRNKIIEITTHYDNCKYQNTSIPINECPCNCYEKQIFNMGRKAEKDLFNR